VGSVQVYGYRTVEIAIPPPFDSNLGPLGKGNSSKFSCDDEELEEGSSLRGAEWGCATTAQRFETTTLFKCVLSANVKPVSEKCWLHTYRVRSFLVCTDLQGFPSLFPPPIQQVHSWFPLAISS
jgi:hypothetical protein